jgi:hypothetical protein
MTAAQIREAAELARRIDDPRHQAVAAWLDTVAPQVGFYGIGAVYYDDACRIVRAYLGGGS